jgi:hypothetical protein
MKTRNPKNSGTQTHGVLTVDDRRPTRRETAKGFALVVTVNLIYQTAGLKEPRVRTLVDTTLR